VVGATAAPLCPFASNQLENTTKESSWTKIGGDPAFIYDYSSMKIIFTRIDVFVDFIKLSF
jgi:hypothetical protein